MFAESPVEPPPRSSAEGAEGAEADTPVVGAEPPLDDYSRQRRSAESMSRRGTRAAARRGAVGTLRGARRRRGSARGPMHPCQVCKRSTRRAGRRAPSARRRGRAAPRAAANHCCSARARAVGVCAARQAAAPRGGFARRPFTRSSTPASRPRSRRGSPRSQHKLRVEARALTRRVDSRIARRRARGEGAVPGSGGRPPRRARAICRGGVEEKSVTQHACAHTTHRAFIALPQCHQIERRRRQRRGAISRAPRPRRGARSPARRGRRRASVLKEPRHLRVHLALQPVDRRPENDERRDGTLRPPTIARRWARRLHGCWNGVQPNTEAAAMIVLDGLDDERARGRDLDLAARACCSRRRRTRRRPRRPRSSARRRGAVGLHAVLDVPPAVRAIAARLADARPRVPAHSAVSSSRRIALAKARRHSSMAAPGRARRCSTASR